MSYGKYLRAGVAPSSNPPLPARARERSASGTAECAWAPGNMRTERSVTEKHAAAGRAAFVPRALRRRGARRTPQVLSRAVHNRRRGCQRRRGAHAVWQRRRCGWAAGVSAAQHMRALACGAAPRTPRTLPAAAPPMTPFQKSFFPRTPSDTHCERRARVGRLRLCTGLGLAPSDALRRGARTSTAAKMPPMAAKVTPYMPITRPVATSAGQALPLSTFGTSWCTGARAALSARA